MAFITVTYTPTNGQTSDISQINQNFADIIAGTSDGTKDFSINALTLAGALTANGSVTLGNATTDDVTVTGSLASSIAVKTTNSYDIGSSTIGLRSIYLSDADNTVRLMASASTSATYTFTLPVSGGTSGYLMETDGSGTTTWREPHKENGLLHNCAVDASVSGNALTVQLLTAAGSTPSSSSPIKIGFRSSTAGSGSWNVRSVTGSLSVTVSSGSTLGQVSGRTNYVYVYAIDNSGTVELAVSSARYDDGTLVSTTAEGGAGASDSQDVMYSTTARTSVPCRLIGRLKQSQTTAGTWASAPTEISNMPFEEEEYYVANINSSWNNVGSSSGTCMMRLVRRGNIVTMTLDGILNTTNLGAAPTAYTVNTAAAVVPTRFRPAAAFVVPVPTYINASSFPTNMGYVSVGTNGNIGIRPNATDSTANWNGSGGNGNEATTMSWTVV